MEYVPILNEILFEKGFKKFDNLEVQNFKH